ncbi:hypothetical protein D0962_25335 [Leptolyngbyaceae cyanobacterium CCMR0082]|uniref:Uncharacterized protein n=2 Tax=Adonisia turfae TaxID=2950184 RepID=A0A6M0SC34_9CYAN|nr:hypothetical protein [Adonisia turfae]MDV3352900.1 hypothetical protein [Leptothoe sp. LEGE 181152]NEZ56415.1 hypothetical protein [Adonisia turfae CCMR0081]NEZ66045.1 hypothetical protein [Adonisia turfae CCMR0082]
MQPFRSYSGLLVGFIVFGIVIWLANRVHGELNDPGFAQTILIAVSGWAGGWLVGFLVAPNTSNELKNLSQATSTITAFVAGFIMAKIEPSFTPIFADGQLMNEPIYGIRVLIFIICFVVAAINMYVFREFNGRY